MDNTTLENKIVTPCFSFLHTPAPMKIKNRWYGKEEEDIEVMEINFDKALSMIDEGEIKDG